MENIVFGDILFFYFHLSREFRSKYDVTEKAPRQFSLQVAMYVCCLCVLVEECSAKIAVQSVQKLSLSLFLYHLHLSSSLINHN